jgi:hypothetical protein
VEVTKQLEEGPVGGNGLQPVAWVGLIDQFVEEGEDSRRGQTAAAGGVDFDCMAGGNG